MGMGKEIYYKESAQLLWGPRSPKICSQQARYPGELMLYIPGQRVSVSTPGRPVFQLESEGKKSVSQSEGLRQDESP